MRQSTRMTMLVAIAGLLAVALVLLGPAFPRLAWTTAAHFAGAGTTVTPAEHLSTGWYEMTWTARAGGQPAKGCLFGLRLDQVEPDAPPDPKERRVREPDVNLSYRTLGSNTSLTGSSGPILLDAGQYRFIVVGGCAWEVTVVPASTPDPLPTPTTPSKEMSA